MLKMEKMVSISDEGMGTVLLNEEQFNQLQAVYNTVNELYQRRYDEYNKLYFVKVGKVPLIKIVRDMFGINLKEAKIIVDYLAQENK